MVQGPCPDGGHDDGEELNGSSPSSSAGGSGPDQSRPLQRPAGFVDGAPADVLAPGPDLAGLLHAVTGSDGAALGTLTAAEVLGAIAASRRIASWAAWAETTALAEFGRRRAAPGEPPGTDRGAAGQRSRRLGQ